MIQQLTYSAPADAEQLRLFFRYEQANARTEYLPHQHRWGQVIFVKCNVLEMQVEGERLLTPPNLPIWVPPGQQHASYNHKQAHFRTLNIAAEACDGLPDRACLLRVSPVVHAIIEECARRELGVPKTEQDQRLCEVLLDQLRTAESQQSYLPSTSDKMLSPVLLALEQNPGDNTTLAQWAKRVYTTERTLSRRCQSQLGMSFSEWRQRLRFLHAISLLEQGKSVQEVALDLGYSSASALIVMFQQQSGTTPERYRHRSAG
ncbi:helix-turn-helix transcriptional regulator [Erwinia persicina]|uniref:AraC family transcriptional regulator n=1 Tax=Erwinia persicina TaxID=55211 RepID=UPI00210C31BE|nr:helix-turn-helix transcriptional regulator [Erwinia persicina]MCQ4093449.1 helix-turn-helix transcriptional regulator [Erwinia persicina]MCQ4099217.1 helix-turn-helix transcriptional regulator [Erwinia persicina]